MATAADTHLIRSASLDDVAIGLVHVRAWQAAYRGAFAAFVGPAAPFVRAPGALVLGRYPDADVLGVTIHECRYVLTPGIR